MKMPATAYKHLHDENVSSKPTSCVILAVVMACLTVLGIILAIAILERPSSSDKIDGEKIFPLEPSVGSCSMTLVESIPVYMKYNDNATFGRPLETVWEDLIAMATEQLDVVSFYWTLTGADISVNSSSAIPGTRILTGLESLPARNVSVRVLISNPSVHTNSTDLKVLQQKGVQVREVDFGRLTDGVLHSKFWIVDRKHLFIGSPNMDWRALTQVKELGVVIHNCSELAIDLEKIFNSYWEMGLPNSTLPDPWPSKYDTNITKLHPLLVKEENITSQIYISGSPPLFCPLSRTLDLDAILTSISEAQHYVDVAVMEYLPLIQFEKPQRYWSVLDDAIRAAAFDRKVKIRMLISCGRESNPSVLPFLQSLAALDSNISHISIKIKLFIVPVGNQTDIPYSRVNHNKYMVTDKVAYIGTSNWSGDYFTTTGGVGLVISQHAPHLIWKKSIQSQLSVVFERDWNSQFAVYLDELGHHPDCALVK
ncbi:5'-3' exonuclease PLD4 isoform X2 [Boleophthalmus pectinirostris]|uniref:5'-3' exonuclease PLD4 isoform X2 n=1 Tax=Boleophthalmus pectinirostris TaxID=150288 RepID=UPI00242F1EDA|nr:5'-3' exonuclease PLD4 isoform X2 [Boleophthalmus pectinirostris]XP_055016479.1 5'-3' exonuclease PLD4 isoform X2 [Boleophthalmus pectinirostris]